MSKLFRPKGRQVWQTLIRLPDGRRMWRTTGCTDRRAAEARARQVERDVAEAGDAKNQTHPLGDALAYFIADRERIGRAAGTVSMHKVKAGHLIRLLGGNHNVNSLKLDDVAAYIDTRKVEGACTNTIAKELITLRAALRVARKRGVYDGHPEDLIPTGFSPHYVPRKRWLSPAEFEKLLLQLPADRRAHVAIMVFTGVRLSESAALRPEHVDIEKRRLYIPGTKTEQAGTTVPLAAAAVPWLMALLGHRPAGQAELLTPWRNIRRDLRLACDKAEIDPVSPNDLRRTFSSWLEQAGVPRGTNARLMRHTTTAMVDKVYAQSAFETLSAAADLLPAGPTVSVGLLPAPPESRPDKVASDGAKK